MSRTVKPTFRDRLLMGVAKRIQGFGSTEGGISKEILYSFLTGQPANSVEGLNNAYKTYDSQVSETYRKYNGLSSWGCQQLRSIVDLRTAFIAKEGLSVAVESPTHREWMRKFLRQTRIGGTKFFDTALGGELTGKALLYLKSVPGDYPMVYRLPYGKANAWKVEASNPADVTTATRIYKEDSKGNREYIPLTDFVYIKLAGDDIDLNTTTTRVGVVLSDIENYDRALKDIRRLNHITARVTPTFKTKDGQETREVLAQIDNTRWKIGKAWVGTSEFDYKNPGTGAHENLLIELSSIIKTIASTTGVPVHWIGWVDLMSNRATAETLYDTIKNATSRERTIYSERMKDLLIKAQEIYIDSGGTDISTVERDIDVRIPVIDYAQFSEVIRSLSIAYGDEVISRADYQNMLPIDSLTTNEQIARERRSDSQNLISRTQGDEENGE